LSDAVQGTIVKANAIAGQPYQPYNAQRIAAPTSAMETGWQTALSGAGAYKPAFDTASGVLNSTVGQSALTTASPFLNQSAKTWDTAAANQYMSPYVDAVNNRVAELGARNLQEQLMPAINDDFVRAGQYGGSRQQEATGRALRDVSEGVLAQQSANLNSAYGQAQSAFQSDQSRLGNLGQVMGNLSSIDFNNNLGLSGALQKLGQGQQSAAILQGTTESTVGREQQAEQQKNLDLAYQDFQNQKNYPFDMVKFLSGIESGVPNVGGTTYTTNNAPLTNAYQPSGLAQIAGSLSLASALGSLFKKKGGMIKRDDAVLYGDILPPPPKPRKKASGGYVRNY
jgi:hypothetical protein